MRTKHKTIYLILGVLGLLGTAIWALATVVMLAVPPAENLESGISYAAFSGACTLVFAVPTIVLLYLYLHSSRREREQLTIVSLLRSGPEISVKEVADRIRKTPDETEVLISKLVSDGTVQGYLERNARKFVAMAIGVMGPGQVPQIVIQAPPAPPPVAGTGTPERRFCRECGSPIERAPGQSYWQCSHCGNIQ